MKQIVQNQRGELKVEEFPAPSLRDGGVLVRTAYSVVSPGTERTNVERAQRSLLAKARERPDLVKAVLARVRRDGIRAAMSSVNERLAAPQPMGYSSSGIVEAIGAGAEEFAVGDWVACAGGGYATHSELVWVPKNLVAKIPRRPETGAVSLEDAAFTTLGAIALQGVRQADPTLGSTVAVLGLGLLGLITVQLLRAAGCAVVACDFHEGRRELARRFGATDVAPPGADFAAAVRRATAGRGADAVIITAGTDSNAPIVQGGEISRDRGRVVIVGAVRADIPRSPFFEREIEVRFSRSYGPGRYDPSYEEKGNDYPIGYVRWTEKRNMEAVLDLLASGRLTVRELISHRYPVERAADAYAMLTSGADATGILIAYGAEPARPARVVTRAESPRLSGTMSIGLVGAGSFARGVLLPAIKAVPGIELRGVVTATGISARHAAEHSGFAYGSTDLNELLNDERVDAVVIATRHGQHAAQVIAALNAGKHVFVEKPLCTAPDDLPRIRDAYERALERFGPRTLMVGFNRRFAPHTRRLRTLLASRRGPLSMHYRVNAGFIPAESWVHDPVEGAGRLIGEGCHFLDWMRELAGAAPTRVVAESVGPDGAVVMVRFADGSVGTLQYVTNGNAALPKERVEVHADDFSAVLDDYTTLSWHSPSGPGTEILKLQDKGHRAEVADFLDAIRTGRQPIPFDQLLESMQMTFAAADSVMTASVMQVDG